MIDDNPRTMTNDEALTALQALWPELRANCLVVVRADRHAPTSPILRVIVKRYTPVDFMSLTQLAGIFETPKITIEAYDGIQSPTPEIEGSDWQLRITVQW